MEPKAIEVTAIRASRLVRAWLLIPFEPLSGLKVALLRADLRDFYLVAQAVATRLVLQPSSFIARDVNVARAGLAVTVEPVTLFRPE